MNERHNQARGASEWADTYGSLGSAPQVQFRELPIHLLDPWQDADGNPQPFDPYTEEEMEELAENIRLNGVIEAICVRPRPNGRFQIIAGHHRTKAAELADLTVIPAKIEFLDDNQAAIRMVDSNLKRRKKIKHSNKAFAYRVRLEALKRQGKRPDITSGPVGQKLSRDEVAEETGESSRQIQRYIRLTELIRPLLDMVDDEKLAFRAGVELSYLDEADQRMLLEVMESRKCKAPSMAQATQLREEAAQGELTTEQILAILVKPKKEKPATVKLPANRISSFFPQNTTPEQMEAEIYEALMTYRKNNNTSASA